MKYFFTAITCAMMHLAPSAGYGQQINLIENNADIGPVLHAGKLQYDPASQAYTISGSGVNVWGKNDELHYAYRKIAGNFILQARVKFLGKGKDPHRKAGWMVRTSLDPAAPMIAASLHGDGLASLQMRNTSGTDVTELKSDISMPDVLQLERRGDEMILSVAKFGQPFTIVQKAAVPLQKEVFAGLFVCSHDKDVVESATFDNVRFVIPAKDNFNAYREYIGSYIELLDVTTGSRIAIHAEPRSLQAPNYLNATTLLYNSDGLIHTIPAVGGTPATFNTGTIRQNNNDHVISFDGKMIGLSSSSGPQQYGSLVYVVPSTGGDPRQVTPTGPSYLHGFSPDGKWLTYTGLRNNEYDIYKMPVAGGEEIRLTSAPGLDDGSEYSPDGKHIYFNSTRTGKMQLWRMDPDGGKQTQLTNDEFNNWFPHISPDGKWIAFLSYQKEVKADDHPFYKQVYLRLMPADLSTPPTVIAYLYGGQGSINTPSWSPDGKRIAFVSNSDIIKK